MLVVIQKVLLYLIMLSIEYERINPFDNPEMAVKYRVRSVPTVILFEENEEIKRTIGFKPEEINEIISMM